ncbi:MAG TPA: DUF1549 and DUF1553 domain-containing protein [Pirellulales bacterium]|nr:DUF1549 and DUF1553 domain-containing protein [Pirellulales bacterium]
MAAQRIRFIAVSARERFSRLARLGAIGVLTRMTAVLLPSATVVSADDHWAFRPLGTVSVPAVSGAGPIDNPIDGFILTKLAERGLTISPPVEPRALLRRAAFDLTGLPPTPEEIAAFEADASATAWSETLDRLLASPHFGERWGRHWLDQAGYVDVLGGDNDAGTIKFGENKWLYRDYVVASFNADKPFDRFLTEQLAGDELVDWRSAADFTPSMRELLIATGFLRVSADDTDEHELNTLDIRYGVLHRTTEIVVTNLLGLTIGCAKCHDHKFEPITQRDYYRFEALLQPALNPHQWLQPRDRQLAALPPAAKADAERTNAELDQQIAAAKAQIESVKQACAERLRESRFASLPEPIRADTKAALAAGVEKRTEVQRYLAEKFQALAKISPEEVAAGLNAEEKDKIGGYERQIAEQNGRKRTWPHWQVVYDVGPPTPTCLLRRGNHLAPGSEVAPGFPHVLCAGNSGDLERDANGNGSAGATSGRRLALAHWLTAPGSPAASLVARVWVNRVWQHLFGRGIVETSDNFGLTGSPPTHPELLDWLATRLIADGWQLKPLVKQIMLSSTYRQMSVERQPDAPRIDPDNRLLWRQRLRRLESETIRDAILAASGRLDRSVGGPPVPLVPQPDGSFTIKPEQAADRFRKTIYLLMRRNYHPTLLAVFDQPVLTTNCTRRDSSAVVLQSLTMLNDDFVVEESAALAARVSANAGASWDERIDMAFRLTLGRRPADDETAWCRETVERDAALVRAARPEMPVEQASLEALSRLCQTLVNSSEFLYLR